MEVNKVQTYVSFDKESIRNYLEDIRVLYPDAFLSRSKNACFIIRVY